jgi:hypothetical protein
MDMNAAPQSREKVAVFCCYARRDQPLLDELKIHLMPLIREGLITLWADTDIHAGEDWEQQIQLHLDAAALILLLVSPDFLASDYCYSVEMRRALQRQACGDVRVLPVIVRPVSWQRTPLGRLQALPTGAFPVTSRHWHSQDEALYNVVEGIRDAVEAIAREQSGPETGPASLVQDGVRTLPGAGHPGVSVPEAVSSPEQVGRAVSSPGRPAVSAAEDRAQQVEPGQEHQAGVSLWFQPGEATPAFYRLQQRVWLPPAEARFALLPYQVTNREFQRFLQAEPFWQRGGQCRAVGKVDDYYLAHWTGMANPDHPVVNVSWHAAEAYVYWLGQQLHQLLRLPRQQEWELAARCGRSEPDWWLEEIEQGRVNCARTEGRMTWVGAFPENPYGLYSILGNVYELCALSDGEIAGYGGAFHCAPRELVLPLALEPHECREDVGFRFVQEVG